MKNSSYIQTLKEIGESSSIHGIPNFIKSKSLSLKLIWIFAFVGSFSYCIFSLITIIINYFNFNVLVRMQIFQSHNTEFPAVTFCNINPFDYTINENFKNVSLLLNESFIYDDNFNSQICDNDMAEVLNFQLPNLKGFSLEKLLISCQYDREPCNLNNFYLQRAFYFRNCYTFNLGKNSTGHSIPIKKTKRPGNINGLKLKIFVGAPEYQPCWENRFGAVVVVHNKSTPPLYAEEGIFVQTGAETNLILKKYATKKLPYPYSNCIANLSDKNAFDSISYRNTIDAIGTYRQRWCVLNCSFLNTIEENRSKCLILNLTSSLERSRCINNLQNLTNYYEKCFQECPVECASIYYKIFQSSSSFPSYSYSKFLLSKTSFRSKFPYENISLQQVRDSVLSLNVYFDSNNFERVEELPEYDFPLLLGNLGGQLGLFIGASFLTFVELIEIIFQIITIYCENNIKKKSLNKIKIEKSEC